MAVGSAWWLVLKRAVALGVKAALREREGSLPEHMMGCAGSARVFVACDGALAVVVSKALSGVARSEWG